jgi:catechol 2,3-dioxygenase-like lactoylglutathione lyase family enzyme
VDFRTSVSIRQDQEYNKKMKLVELAYFTEDVDRVVAFYRTLLGAEPVARAEGMAIFLIGDTKIFIHHSYSPAEGELPPTNHTAFSVEDVDKACQELVEQGVALEIPPKDYYWGRSAYLRDPDGNQIEITASQ